MSLLDGLFGSASAPPGEMGTAQPSQNTFGDRLMNPMSQIGLALLANHGTPKTQRGMFDGVGEAVTNSVSYQRARQREAQAEAEKNETLKWLEQSNPEVFALVQSGLDPAQAYNYVLQKQNTAADNARADRAFGLQAAAAGREQAGWNAAAKYLESQGADPGLVDLARAGQGGEAMRLYSGGSGGARLSTQPVWGKDADGNDVLGQLSNDGRFVPSALPEGVSAVSPSSISEGRAYGGARGKARAEAEGALPGAQGRAAMVLGQINDLKNDPYLPNMLGPWNSKMPNVTSEAARVQGRMDQLQGGAFLEARQMLKGGGAITDFESQRAEAAFARLGAAQSVNDYKKALDEFGDAVTQGLSKLEQGAGRSVSAPPPVQIGDYVIEQVD